MEYFHMYADDIKLYLDIIPEDEVSAHATIAGCVMEIKAWLSDNFLLLNENKTEAMTVMSVNQPAVAKSIKLNSEMLLSHCRRLSRTLEQCSTKSTEWKNMQPEFVGVQTIICTVFEGLETALTSATPSC